jgi:hypothetical protein
MKSNTRTPPTQPKLEASTDLLFGVMSSCFAYFLWWTQVRPLLENADLLDREIVIQMQSNAVVEGTLLSIRKVNDFFRPSAGSKEMEDDVFSYDFRGFKATGKFLHPDNFSELHKRVGHITLREIRHGKVSWEMHRAVVAAATKYIEFAQFLQNEFFAQNETRKHHAADCERVVRRFLSEMEMAKEGEERA